MALCLTAGFLVNRYTPRVYAVNSSILIKDDQDVSGSAAELLYGNQLFNNSRNLNNESIIIESFPLIRGVLGELDFDKVFYKEGNVRTTEVFKDAPARILIDSSSSELPYGQSIVFDFNGDNTFTFSLSGTEGQKSKTHKFYDLIEFNGMNFRVLPNENGYKRTPAKRRVYIQTDEPGCTNQ